MKVDTHGGNPRSLPEVLLGTSRPCRSANSVVLLASLLPTFPDSRRRTPIGSFGRVLSAALISTSRLLVSFLVSLSELPSRTPPTAYSASFDSDLSCDALHRAAMAFREEPDFPCFALD